MKSTVLIFSEHSSSRVGAFEDEFTLFQRQVIELGGKNSCTSPELFTSGPESYIVAIEGKSPDILLSAANSMAKHGIKGHIFIDSNSIGSEVSFSQIEEMISSGHIIGPIFKNKNKFELPKGKFQSLRDWEEAADIFKDYYKAGERCALLPKGFKASGKALRIAARTGVKTLFTRDASFRCRYVSDCLVVGTHPIINASDNDYLSLILNRNRFKLLLRSLIKGKTGKI